MSKKTIITCLCAGCCLAASAQTDLESFREQYQFNQRDLQVVERYVDALENAGMYKEAENVAKEYMSRCPVVQITDKDTYLLLNKYLFTDPYSNVFEYGIYAVKNMKWDREEPTTKEEKDARMKRLFRDMRYGVSGVDEIDKRYEILSLLSRNLKMR